MHHLQNEHICLPPVCLIACSAAICLSVRLSAYLSVCLFAHLSVFVFLCPSICLYVALCHFKFAHLSECHPAGAWQTDSDLD